MSGMGGDEGCNRLHGIECLEFRMYVLVLGKYKLGFGVKSLGAFIILPIGVWFRVMEHDTQRKPVGFWKGCGVRK